MSLYTIEIDDAAIMKQVSAILTKLFEDELSRKYSGTGDVIADAVKELVYSRKDEIIDKVVNRSAKEITRKGLTKLLERMSNNETN